MFAGDRICHSRPSEPGDVVAEGAGKMWLWKGCGWAAGGAVGDRVVAVFRVFARLVIADMDWCFCRFVFSGLFVVILRTVGVACLDPP